MAHFLEIACFSEASALEAIRASTDRIELCASAHVGGTTPSFDSLKQIRAKSRNIPINIMIRPRGGNFIYTNEEFEEMSQQIHSWREIADGFVFGILDETGKVHEERNSVLVDSAGGKACTFHRAFDDIPESEMVEQLKVISACGFTAVLTSGGASCAVDGILTLKKLVEVAKTCEVEIIVGGGVRAANIAELMEYTGATWYHSSALTDDSDRASFEEIGKILKMIGKNLDQD